MEKIYILSLFLFNYTIKTLLSLPIFLLLYLSMSNTEYLTKIDGIYDYIDINSLSSFINTCNSYSIYVIYMYLLTPILSILMTIIKNGNRNIDSWLISQGYSNFENILLNVNYDDDYNNNLKNTFKNVLNKHKINSSIKIKLYVIDSEVYNALSIDNFKNEKRVILYRGAINQSTEEELERIISHELSHLSFGDSKINIILYSIYKNIDLSFQNAKLFYSSLSIKSYLFLVLPLIYMIMAYIRIIESIKTFMVYILIPIQLTIFKRREFLRDLQSSKIISKDRLVNVLTNIIKKENNKSIFERLYDTHPSPSTRIKKILNNN